MSRQRAERLLVVELSGLVGATLCTFCRYADFGWSPCDCDIECTHPLAWRLGTDYGWFGLEPGDDCWGWRPHLPVEDIADIVGIVLANDWTWWYYLTDDQGQLRVFENKAF